MSILHVKGVSKSFAGLKALNDVNLAVEEGSVHAIIGPNGAGKSTLLNCFVGRLAPDSGSVTFDGKSLVGLAPHEINQTGVARVFQTPEIFGDLSVLENVVIPALARRDGAFAFNAWPRADAPGRGAGACRARAGRTSAWPASGTRSPATSRAATSAGWNWRCAWCRSRGCC